MEICLLEQPVERERSSPLLASEERRIPALGEDRLEVFQRVVGDAGAEQLSAFGSEVTRDRQPKVGHQGLKPLENLFDR